MACTEQADNTTSYQATPVFSVPVESGEESTRKKWEPVEKFQLHQNTKFVVNPQDFIWLELSLVPEVERVFVERHNKTFTVLSVVNDRDMDLRKRVFAREKAIIDALPQYEFDFGILTRMNYDLHQLMSDSDKPSYFRQ